MRERRVDSTAERMRQFFKANPQEELTVDDVAAKFDVHRQAVYRALSGHPKEFEYVHVIRRRST